MVEEKIAALESGQPELLALLSAAETSPEDRQEAGRRLQDITRQITELTAEWDELATRLSG